MTGKSSKICILCVEPVLKYPRPRISLHSFPSCPKKRQIWIKQCKLTNVEVSPNCKICSFHFEPTCFKSSVKRRILYPDAVPTIFKKFHVKMANRPLKNTKVLERQKKCNKNGMADEIYQARNIALTRASENVIEGQNCQGHGTSSTKAAENVIICQYCQSDDISPTKFAKEVFERVMNIVSNKKRELDELDEIIIELEKEVSSVKSQLESVRSQIIV